MVSRKFHCELVRFAAIILLGVAWVAGLPARSQPATTITNLPAPPVSPKSQVLGVNDSLLVEVYQEPDLEARRRVEPDGSVTLPLLGRVTLGGKTVEEAQKLITELLAKDYLVNPRVTVTVLERAKWKFTIMGKVVRQGSIELSNSESVNLVQAIAMAGGVTTGGNLKKVTVSRHSNGTNQVMEFDVQAMMKANAKPFQVLPDDDISVPEKIW